MTLPFALNQKTVGHLSFTAFLDLAADLGCVGVEPRNDLGRPIFDGLDPAVAGQMATDRGLKLLSLCEVYGFNVWSKEREAQIAAMIDLAEVSGAEAITLIPSVDDRPVSGVADALRILNPLFEGRPVTALIEVVGFETSTIRLKRPLVEAMDRIGGPFRLVHDTFQHAISGETEQFPDHTGLVHISGLSDRDLPLDQSSDGRRGLVDEQDRCGTVRQISEFEKRGYVGAFSIEVTNPSLINSSDLPVGIAQCFSWIGCSRRAM